MLSAKAQRRLAKAVQIMESLPRDANKHFYMGRWFGHNTDDHSHGIQYHTASSRRLLKTCGTTACALGWLATDPSFKRAGLSVSQGGPTINGMRYPEAYQAAADFFDISELQASLLFGGHTHVRTPKAWAKRAKKFISRWSKQ